MMSHRQPPKRIKAVEKKNLRVFIAIALALLAANIFLLLRIEAQLRSANDALNQLNIMQNEKEGSTRQESDNVIQNVKQEKQQEYMSASNNVTVVGTLDYVSLCGLPEVDKPIERSYREVLAKLNELGQDNAVIAQIFEDSEIYPEKLLEALANNPEMADFVENYHEKKGQSTGGLTDAEKKQEYPLFLQWDPRWGYAKYGDDSNIGLSGCGPTCLSMVLYYLTKDETLTPDKVAAYSLDNGYYMAGTGTLWSLLEELPLLYGVEVSSPETYQWAMEAELDKGNILICSMGAGDFTVGGHFIVIYGYDENGFKVNDSNCVARSRQSWTFKQIEKQIKHIWSFGK